jgi:hypothetical protein
MRHSFLISAVLAALLAAPLTACTGGAPGIPATNDQPLASAGDPALAAVTANLPAGTTVATASQADLARAVRRTVRAHPELSRQIVVSIQAVAPDRTAIVKKAIADATAPTWRGRARGGEH